MDRPAQINELTVLLNRAKRSGLKVHHYPEQHLVILRVPAYSEETSHAAPPPVAPASPVPTPAAQ